MNSQPHLHHREVASPQPDGGALAPEAQSRPWRTIFVAGAVAGTLDILYVFIYYAQAGPMRVLQGVAAGALGPAAGRGGWSTAALGLAFHFLIAFVVAAVFYAASRKLPGLLRHALLAGVFYGAAVWLAMQLVVLPLTAVPPKSFPPPNWVPVFIAHLICVGPPIALVTRWFSRRR